MRIFKQWLLVLFGLALLNANALGAHLHLCFDGKEPFSSLHVLDGPQELNHASASSQHHDVDVKLAGEAITKASKFQLSLAVVCIDYSVPVTLRVATATASLDSDGPPPAAYRELLPPSRGPPV